MSIFTPKNFFYYLSRLSLSFLIIVLVSLATFYLVIGSPSKIKSSLVESGVYSNLTSSILETVLKQTNVPKDSIPLDNPAVQRIADRTFSPQLWQNTTEQFVDGAFKWLNGDLKSPEFAINLAGSKKEFASGVGDFTINRLKSLPECSYGQIQVDFNVFTARCLPPGTNLAALKKQINKEIVADKNFLPDTKLKAEDLGQDNSFAQAFDQASQVPKYYQMIMPALALIGLVCIILGVAVVKLAENTQKGIKTLAWLLGRVALAVAILGLVLRFLLPKSFDNPAFRSNPMAEKVISPIAEELTRSISTTYFIFSSVLFVLCASLGGWYWLKYVKNSQKKQTTLAG